MNKQKIYNIQALRGIAVLLVMVFHVMLMEKKWYDGERVLPDVLDIGQTGIDLFFIVSGFVMTTITRGKFQKPFETIKFIYNRLSRIYPPYWFYSLILLYVYFLRPDLVNPTLGNRVNILESFLLFPQDILPLLMVGWTLIYEMYFYLLFSLFLLFNEKYFLPLLLLWSAIIVTIKIFLPPPLSSCWVSASYLVVSPFAFEFIFGCIIAKIIYSGKRKYGVFSLFAGLVAFMFIIIFSWTYPHINTTTPWIRVFLFGIPYSVIVYGVTALEFCKNWRIYKPLQALGDVSYSVYLSHSLVINGIGWLWLLTQKTLSIPNFNLLWIFAMLAMSIITGIISYRAIEKPIISVARRFPKRLY